MISRVGKENLKSKVERIINNDPLVMGEIFTKYQRIYRHNRIDDFKMEIRDAVRELVDDGRISRDWNDYGDPIYSKNRG